MDEKIQAGKFKAECLKLMEKVRKTRRKIIITKRGVPIAKLVPIEEKEEKVFGRLKGTIHFKGDIIGPIEEVWNADS
jgi:prevent-host-death family protein